MQTPFGRRRGPRAEIYCNCDEDTCSYVRSKASCKARYSSYNRYAGGSTGGDQNAQAHEIKRNYRHSVKPRSRFGQLHACRRCIPVLDTLIREPPTAPYALTHARWTCGCRVLGTTRGGGVRLAWAASLVNRFHIGLTEKTHFPLRFPYQRKRQRASASLAIPIYRIAEPFWMTT